MPVTNIQSRPVSHAPEPRPSRPSAALVSAHGFLVAFVAVLSLVASPAPAAEPAPAPVLTPVSRLLSSPSPAVRLLVQPSTLTLADPREEHGLLITAVYADGRVLDVTDRAQFTSSQPEKITISPDGVCRAVAAGSAEITASFGGLKAVAVVTSGPRDGARSAPSFRQEIVPLLTRAGCNAGGCHGKLAGQNGFKLSLRGFAPEWDHEALARESRGRRIDSAAPDASLLLLKALARMPHEGGERFAADSRYHRALADWIGAGAPGPSVGESDAASLEVLPGNRTLRVGDRQRLLVRAHYADGQVRDVTWLAQFFSNDEAVVRVTPEGVVEGRRVGETAIRVHFQGQVQVVVMTLPFENQVAPAAFAKRNNTVDQHVFEKLAALHIPPSPLGDDATFLRRASLDTIGTLPTPAEVRAFVADARPDKRAQLVEALLERPEFVDFWTLQLSDLLQNRKERDHDVRGAKGVRSFHTWLRAQVAANRPWHELTRELLTASGDAVTHPQIGYFITTIGEKRNVDSELTDSVAQAFLGTRIGCARCHNHPLERYTQDDFYHFAAFFSRVSLKRESPVTGRTILNTTSKEEQQQLERVTKQEQALAAAETAAAGQSGKDAERAQKKVTEEKKKLEEARKQLERQRVASTSVTQPRTKKMMAPQPLDRAVMDLPPGVDPRTRLMDWMADPANEYFSGSMVNRLWKHFLGVGLVEPVDDLRASNPPSNPALWRELNREFVTHGYNLKHVMRLILNSRTYQLSSETLPGNETDRRFYSHYFARRLPAEVLLDAISQATGVPDAFTGYPLVLRAIQLPDPGVGSYFLGLFGRSDRVTACACERTGDVTLPQLLHLQNGDEILKKLAAADGQLAALLKASADERELIENVFLATVSRMPSSAEVAAVSRAFAAGGTRAEAGRDLFWALLNAKDFSFNH